VSVSHPGVAHRQAEAGSGAPRQNEEDHQVVVGSACRRDRAEDAVGCAEEHYQGAMAPYEPAPYEPAPCEQVPCESAPCEPVPRYLPRRPVPMPAELPLHLVRRAHRANRVHREPDDHQARRDHCEVRGDRRACRRHPVESAIHDQAVAPDRQDQSRA
jgi:hypothetical protein